MAGGGRRPGAGRKPGSPNKATQARQKEIASTGATPLEVMIDTMRFHYDAAKRAVDDEAATASLALAKDAARDAAPYVHPRLAAVQVGGGETPIKHVLEVVWLGRSKEKA